MKKLLTVLVIVVLVAVGWVNYQAKAQGSSFSEALSAEIIELRSSVRLIAEEIDKLWSAIEELRSKKLGAAGESDFNVVCRGEGTDGRVCFGGATGTFTSTTTAFWTLPRSFTERAAGKEIHLTRVELFNTAKASSTILYWSATSTIASTTVADYHTPVPGNQFSILQTAGKFGIGAFLIGTSTVATGTERIVHMGDPKYPNVEDVVYDGTRTTFSTTTATSTAILRDGEGIVFGRLAPSRNCGGSAGPTVATRSCESASTSAITTRWMVDFWYAE